MSTAILVIVIAGVIINMVADVLMVSGRYENGRELPLEERSQRTKDQHLISSALIGMLAIALWLTPGVLLGKLASPLPLIFFMFYIASCMAFHVLSAFSILVYKTDEKRAKLLKKAFAVAGALCTIWSLAYTVLMIIMFQNGTLQATWFHYLTLPVFTMVQVQFVLGKMLNFIPFFSSVAGSLGVGIYLLGTLHLLSINGIS